MLYRIYPFICVYVFYVFFVMIIQYKPFIGIFMLIQHIFLYDFWCTAKKDVKSAYFGFVGELQERATNFNTFTLIQTSFLPHIKSCNKTSVELV